MSKVEKLINELMELESEKKHYQSIKMFGFVSTINNLIQDKEMELNQLLEA